VSTIAEVRLWGSTIGAVSLADGADVAAFQYESRFAQSGIELSPLMMPLRTPPYQFPELSRRSFRGLPGLLADSLPDKFGNALLAQWLATQGRSESAFNAVERLCYVGQRGMGALEFLPATGPSPQVSQELELAALTQLASEILTHRATLNESFDGGQRGKALENILRVGTSAGGARAKAIIAWNPVTNEVRSGQVPAPASFSYWLLKFDGVSGNKDKEIEDPQGFTVIEYAYALMARAAGIEMTECRLLEEGGRRHFITRRYDRLEDGAKLHAQSLAALAHLDFNNAEANSYEQAFDAIKRLNLSMHALEQQFRRMVFNVVARNQDDHVKNISFLMDRQGQWSLAPAYDMTYAYNPNGLWTARHQMSINGKRDGFTVQDFRACVRVAGLKRGRAEALLEEVTEVVSQWGEFAQQAGVIPEQRKQIKSTHRLKIPVA
jgi:serine/threonine-protein kinase HipA